MIYVYEVLQAVLATPILRPAAAQMDPITPLEVQVASAMAPDIRPSIETMRLPTETIRPLI